MNFFIFFLNHAFWKSSRASLTWRQKFYFIAILLQLRMSRRREFHWQLFSMLIFLALTLNSWTTRLLNVKWKIKNTRDFSRKKSLKNKFKIWRVWKIEFNEIDLILIQLWNDFETFSNCWCITISSTKSIWKWKSLWYTKSSLFLNLKNLFTHVIWYLQLDVIFTSLINRK